MRGGMETIRRDYGVPAKRGMLVLYDRGDGPRLYRITSSNGQYIFVRGLHGGLHPMWQVAYLDHDGRMLWGKSLTPGMVGWFAVRDCLRGVASWCRRNPVTKEG